jgi:beta-galactosidase
VTGTASIWAEALEPRAADVRTLATFVDPGGWLDGKAAIVSRKVGRGSITYVGAWLDHEAMAKLASGLLADVKVSPLVPDAHPDLEVAERAGGDKRVLVVINHGAEPHALSPPVGATFASGDWTNGQVPAHGVALFRMK